MTTARTAVPTRLLAAALAAHCAWFLVFHVAWILGWRWGIPRGMASVPQRPAFLAYVVVASIGMAVLGALGVGIAARPALLGARWARGLLILTIGVCGARALLGIAMDAVALVQGTALTGVTVSADVWFAVAAVLAGALWVSGRSARG